MVVVCIDNSDCESFKLILEKRYEPLEEAFYKGKRFYVLMSENNIMCAVDASRFITLREFNLGKLL